MAYRTKQSKEILAVIEKYGDRHVTASMIKRKLEDQGSQVSLATVYRQLEKLEDEGLIRKFFLDGKAAACFQYSGDDGRNCGSHYHLKCEQCGKLIHLRCSLLDEVEEHVLRDHGFTLNPLKTVFYGLCAACSEKRKEKTK